MNLLLTPDPFESSWGAALGPAANTSGSDKISPAVTYNYSTADRLYSVSSGGMTGTITRTSSQESLTVNFSGLYTSPYSTYNRILRNGYGQPQSHLASYTIYSGGSPWTYTLRDNAFTWDSNRLASRGEGDTTWNYIYDSKGQIEKAHRRFNATEILAGSQSVYAYDDIGNRKELKEGGGSTLDNGLRTTTYTANSLNQYETIIRQQKFDVTGKRTSTSASITVNDFVLPANGYQPNGNGLHFRREVDNTPASLPTGDIFEPVTVTQTIGSGSAAPLTEDPIQFVPPSVTNSPPRYDLDGNLLSDGRWTYTWDGENRLLKMVSIAWTQPAGGYLANANFPAYTLEFAYDGLSRRVQKKTIKNGTAEMEGYLYDGWNVVMISNLDAGNGAHLARKWSCVWRPDIGSRLYARGSWQAAGGVGGLAWMQTGIAQTVAMYTYQSVSGNAEVHIPMMDHMGNVRHYYQIKTTGVGASASYVSGQITANLDYDAFGREVRATGPKTPASGQPPGLAPGDPWVDVLPFHFSTKFTDRESGLNYYGYRFYDSIDGRWLNRDPIGEEGGLNLHTMVNNRPTNATDYLGLLDARVRKVGKCEVYVFVGHGSDAPRIEFIDPKCGWASNVVCYPNEANGSKRIPTDHAMPSSPSHNRDITPSQNRKHLEGFQRGPSLDTAASEIGEYNPQEETVTEKVVANLKNDLFDADFLETLKKCCCPIITFRIEDDDGLIERDPVGPNDGEAYDFNPNDPGKGLTNQRYINNDSWSP